MTEILIVDDKSNDRYMLEKLLKGYGYDVVSASNGAEAIEIARKKIPDMIITDIMMPVMDGFALCNEWKKDEKLKNIPFIFYTATYTSAKDEEFALNIGSDRFIVKPQDPENLVAKLHEVIEEYRSGKLVASTHPLGEEMEFFKKYNEVLFKKLETKMVEVRKLNESLEEQVKERTRELNKKNAELNAKNAELERLNKVFVGRELRMVELKKIIADLEAKIAMSKK